MTGVLLTLVEGNVVAVEGDGVAAVENIPTFNRGNENLNLENERNERKSKNENLN